MAAIKGEMPPLHAADALAAATAAATASAGGTNSSSNTNSSGHNGVVGGTNSSSNTAGANSSNNSSDTANAAATTTTTANVTSGSGGGGSGGTTIINNTISAAADSSDNQPGTPQPQAVTAASVHSQQLSGINEHQQATAVGTLTHHHQHQQQQQQQQHHPYATHHMYGAGGTSVATTSASATLPHLYAGGIYASATGQEMQQHQQQQQQQQHLHQQQQQQQSLAGSGGGYPTYLNSYEQFYQQQAQSQMAEYGGASSVGGGGGNTSLMYGSSNGGSSSGGGSNSTTSGVRYHPYLQAPTSGLSSSSAIGGNSGSADLQDTHNNNNNGSIAKASNASSVSTSASMSPRVVSSTSPTSTSTHLQLGGGQPGSPSCKSQCKKCGIMCTNETELQEHITNVHGASPYGGSSGYSSSPYIKEELQSAGSGASQQGVPTQSQQAAGGGGGGNPGDILDLDSQKMVYPPLPGGVGGGMLHGGMLQHTHPLQQMHDADPLHSMHTMQQRALPNWDQPLGGSAGIGGGVGGGMQEGLPPYLQHQQSQDINVAKVSTNQSPYYSPKQSPYHGGAAIKHEYPLIKSEYAADSQNYVDKSFDPTGGGGDMCQQAGGPTDAGGQSAMMPVSSSPAEFPSTTTGSQPDQQQPYRGFEPPTSSSVLPANSITAKAATWKSNEARRPKTYNCTACNKWFTSSGHLKRHYNTTLHKNAVKSSGQPDPATLPISVHHHPARDPNGKHSRRNNASAAAAAQQQQPPAPVQPPEPPESLGPMSHYSASPSPTQPGNGISPYGQQQQQTNGYGGQTAYGMAPQVQSTTNASPQHASTNSMAGVSPSTPTQSTVLNGHPNGLAGPSAPLTTTPTTTTIISSSHTRGLLNNNNNNTTTATAPTAIITKIEHMEDNNNSNSITTTTSSSSSITTTTHSPMGMADMRLGEVRQLDYLKQEVLEEEQEEAAEAVDQEAVAADQEEMVDPELAALEEQRQQQQQQQQQMQVDQYRAAVEQQQQQQQQQQAATVAARLQQRQYHNSTPSMRAQSPLIILHQQYQQEQQQQLQPPPMAVDSIFSHTTPPPLQPAHMQLLQQPLQPVNIMDTPPGYSSIIPLAISTQQLQQQPLDTTISTSTATTNMDSIHMVPHHHHPTQLEHHPHHLIQHPHHQQLLEQLQQPLQQQQPEAAATLPHMPHNMLLSSTGIQSALDTIISTTITPPPQQLPQPHITSTIPSFQQLQQQASGLAPPEHTMTYHTIIGNGPQQAISNSHNSDSGIAATNRPTTISVNTGSELIQLGTLDAYGNLQSTQTQMLTSSDGQILQFIPTSAAQMMGQPLTFALPSRAAVAETYAPLSPYTAQRSPQEGDLPPAHTIGHCGNMPLSSGSLLMQHHMLESSQTVLPSMPYSPTISSSTTLTALEDYGGSASNDMKQPQPMQMYTMESAGSGDLIDGHVAATTSVSTPPPSDGSPQPPPLVATSTSPTPTTSPTPMPTPTAIAFTTTTTSKSAGKMAKTMETPASNKRSTAAKRKRANTASDDNGQTSPIKCPVCDKMFTKICYLTQHNKSSHSGEYPFRCQKCGKRFQNEDVFNIHLGRHKSLDKPHKCSICPKQFHHKTDLRRHVDAIHTGYKQYTCDVCEKSFCRNDHLRKHLETHTRPRVKRVHKSPKSTKKASAKDAAAAAIAAPSAQKLQQPQSQSQQQQQQQLSTSAMSTLLAGIKAGIVKNEKGVDADANGDVDGNALPLALTTSHLQHNDDVDAYVDDNMMADDESLVDEDEHGGNMFIKEEFEIIEQEIPMY